MRFFTFNILGMTKLLIMNGLEFKEFRKKLKFTQEEIAEKLGVDRRTVINYEKSDNIPDTKVKLLNALLSKESENDHILNSESDVKMKNYDDEVAQQQHDTSSYTPQIKDANNHAMICAQHAQLIIVLAVIFFMAHM